MTYTTGDIISNGEHDAGAPWAASNDYTNDNNLFRVEVTQSTAVDANGDPLPTGEHLLKYVTVPYTSHTSTTLAELALMVPAVESGGGSLFDEDQTTTGTRTHELQHDVTFKRADNAQGKPTFSHTLDSFGAVETKAYDYAADQTTVVSSARHEVNGGGVGLTFGGEAKLSVNGESGLPGDVVVSNGGRGSDPAPGYSAQNLVKVEGGMVDFATAEPTQNLTNAYKRYWNTTGTAQYPIGLYALVSDLNTASGWAWRQELVEGCALSMGGEVYLVDGGELMPMVNADDIDIYDKLAKWQPSHGNSVVNTLFGDVKVARISDSSSGVRLYTYGGQLPKTIGQYVRIEIVKESAGANLLQLRTSDGTNESILRISKTTGDVSTAANGSIGEPEIVYHETNAETIEVVALFPPLASLTQWNLHAATAGANQGTVDIIELDLDYDYQPAEPVVVYGGLDTIAAKLHSVIYPSSGSLCDVSNQGRGLNPNLGDVTFDADGNAVYGDNIRSSVNTESDAATLTIYAMVRYDAALDNDTNVSVFGNVNTFMPIAGTQTSTETIRINGASNSINFSIDGVTNFGTRVDVLAAINTGDFVIVKFEDVPSGTALFIGDHPQNNNFHSTISVKAIVTVEGNPDRSDDLIINHAMRSGIDVSKLSRITSLDTVLANATATVMNNGGGGTGPQFIDHDEPIVITKPDTVLRFEHEADVAQGAAYFTFGTTAGQEAGGVGSLSASAIRLTPTSSDKKIEAVVQPGTYFVRQGAGGGSSVTSSSLKITQICTGSQTITEQADPLNISPIYDGVYVDAAPSWTDGLVTQQGAAAIQSINTGVDLTKVDRLVLYVRRDNDTWQTPYSYELKHFIYDSDIGNMVDHFDNDHLGLRINSADRTAGIIQAFSGGTGATYDLEITEIEFRKRAVGVSNRVGNREWGPSGRTVAEGFLAMNGIVVNGAVDYPVAAARNPAYVSGNNFDFTAWEGAFLRNLGGNAGAEGTRVEDKTAVNGLSGTSSFNRGENTSANGGAFRLTGSGGEVSVNTQLSSTDNETAPVAIAEQLYLIVDTYVEPVNGASGSDALEASSISVVSGVIIEERGILVEMSGVDRSGNTGTRTISLPVALANPVETNAQVTAQNATADRTGRVVSVGSSQVQIAGNNGSAVDLHWSVKGVKA